MTKAKTSDDLVRFRFKQIDSSAKVTVEGYEVLTRMYDYLTLKQRLSPHSAKSYVRSVRTIMGMFGVLRPSEELAEKVELDLRSRGMTPETVRNYLYALKYWAKSLGFDLKIKMPKVTSKRARSLSHNQCKALLAACGNVRNKAIVSVLLHTGVRNKELRYLEVGDVDLKKRVIYVRDHGQMIKNGEENSVVISVECAQHLKDWLDNRPLVENNVLFITDTGQRFTESGLRHLVHNVGKRAGIMENVFPHLLRHTCGTTMVGSGISLALVQRQLRQRNIQSTMKYIHPDEECFAIILIKSLSFNIYLYSLILNNIFCIVSPKIL